jgi:predicted nucleotidyltransferase
MSEGLIERVQGLLQTVSDDVNRLYNEAQNNTETFLEALDDVAANVLGLQSIIAALVKKYPVDADDAKSWLKANMDPDGEGTDKAESVVDFLLGNK